MHTFLNGGGLNPAPPLWLRHWMLLFTDTSVNVKSDRRGRVDRRAIHHQQDNEARVRSDTNIPSVVHIYHIFNGDYNTLVLRRKVSR